MPKHNIKTNTSYVEAYKGFVTHTKPLLISLHKKDGTLLAEKNKKLTEEQAFHILKNGTVFTPRGDLVKAFSNINAINHQSNCDSRKKIACEFERTALLMETLENILLKPNENSLLTLFSLANQLKTACNNDQNQVIAQCITRIKETPFAKFLLISSIIYLITKQMDWQEPEINSLMCAALTLDITLHMNDHKNQKYLLNEIKLTDINWYNYVNNHHLKNAINEDSISWGYSLLKIIDSYAEEIIAGITPSIAIKNAIKNETSPFRKINRKCFLNILGIYPTGTIVKLVNEHIAIIVRQSNVPDKPFAKVIFDKSENRIKVPEFQRIGNFPYIVKKTIQNDRIINRIDYENIWK